MERSLRILPGYDCRQECKHDPPGEHGICADVWLYTVHDGKRGVVLEVLSDRYPPTVERATLPSILRRAMGAVLTTHRYHPAGTPCKLVGTCETDGSYLAGRRLWTEHGDGAQPEQSEAFWAALEAELPEREGIRLNPRN